MQKPGPRGRSSSINPGPGAAAECKTPGVARGGCWCLELTDALCTVLINVHLALTVTLILWEGVNCLTLRVQFYASPDRDPNPMGGSQLPNPKSAILC